MDKKVLKAAKKMPKRPKNQLKIPKRMNFQHVFMNRIPFVMHFGADFFHLLK